MQKPLTVFSLIIVVAVAIWQFVRPGVGKEKLSQRTFKIDRRMPLADADRRRGNSTQVSKIDKAWQFDGGADAAAEDDLVRRAAQHGFVLADELDLNEFQRGILNEIEGALTAGDLAALSAVIAKIQLAGKPGSPFRSLADVPRGLKKAAIAALTAFGASGIPEMIGFLADPDVSVADAAMTEFQQMLQDFGLGDRRTAEIVIAASQVVTDDNALDFILGNVQNMRNSVGMDTILNLYEVGNEKVLEKMPEVTRMFTGEADINTVEKAEVWKAENKDGPDDELFYGPSPDDW